MLKRYQPGDTISGSDENHLLWLLQQHPEFEQKRGVGIVGFTVVPAAYTFPTSAVAPALCLSTVECQPH
jgi:hypothetical protein